MDKKDLNLNGLTMDDIDFSGVREAWKENKQKEKEYQERYGDDWLEYYLAENRKEDLYSNTDIFEKGANIAIYNGHMPFVGGSPDCISKFHLRYREKMERFFGRSWKKHVFHSPNDPKINKLLIQDALKSGKWEELPKELQNEYHRLADD